MHFCPLAFFNSHTVKRNQSGHVYLPRVPAEGWIGYTTLTTPDFRSTEATC